MTDYSQEYCQFLEAAYGSNMMSEGGPEAINRMLQNDDIKKKSLLDIGFGLGGVAFYLAEKYDSRVSGVEVNPALVREAELRSPKQLRKMLNFKTYQKDGGLPFDDANFDVVLSKGVLTHIKDKSSLFSEVFRVLKPGGSFVIDDWLSPQKGLWGEKIEAMCQTENLVLYAENERGYKDFLSEAGFQEIKSRDENASYYRYNQDIIKNLQKRSPEDSVFNDFSLADALDSYSLISQSIEENELLIRWFRAVKPT